MNGRSWRRTAGATLVEVMVALLVLSFGLLGLTLLQGQGMLFNTDAAGRTQATLVAYNIMDSIRLNLDEAVNNGSYTIATQSAALGAKSAYASCSSAGTCNCDTNPCTEAQLAQYALGQWFLMQDELLPVDSNNLSTIAQDNANPNLFTITVRWRRFAESLPTSGSTPPKSVAWAVEF